MNRDLQAEPGGKGAGEPSVEAELAVERRSAFEIAELRAGTPLPLPDEPFVACWKAWAEESATRGVADVLREHLPQLAFPVREGISGTDAYRAATLRGVPVGEIPEATGLALEKPEGIELAIHSSPAGRVPVLVVGHRKDFVSLVRALAKRNEPKPIADSQGAVMIAGYNNWTRLGELRRRWEALPAEERACPTWAEEMGRLRRRKELYQDRFIVLSDGAYSAVPAADLGLEETEWRRLSLAIRRDHECAHYFTRRLFGTMRNHLHDELLADYAGLVAATGCFRAAWFLRFLGLDNEPPRREGRVHLYRGEPPLSDAAFQVMRDWARAAARQVERFDGTLAREDRTLAGRAVVLAALASLSLPELAARDGARRLAEALRRIRSGRQATPDGKETR